jgi:hypothetical protein
MVDEEAVDKTVTIGTVKVDLYEASRPDATGTSFGRPGPGTSRTSRRPAAR